MTCTEAETAADLLSAFGKDQAAEDLLIAHTEHDDPIAARSHRTAERDA
ncbi:hypothetical protein [Mangrovactinospora gilvigrisea]|nr:hypothetical protein [Mangrovactinospora gilvigrisea]